MTEQETRKPEGSKDPRAGVPPKLATLRFKLGQKAKQEPKFRFYALYGHLHRPDVLATAFAQVAAKKGRNTPGVDGVTMDLIVKAENGVATFLTTLGEELRTRTFRPQPVKRVYIPKADGKQRPLGVPTIKDRVVQMAIVLLLEPIFEADFLDCSHGYRPGRSAHDAVEEIQANLRQGYTAVYDADLQSYFDTIPHDKLMTGIETRVADGTLLRLIKAFLQAPIKDGNKPPQRPTGGTPQGGVLSPLLANLFLHWFDRAFYGANGPAVWANAKLVRYVDDFVVMARFIDYRIVSYIEEKIEGRLGLKINRKKTRILQVSNEPLDFLGYRFRYSRSHLRGGGPKYWRREPSPKAQREARGKVHALTSAKQCFSPIKDVIARVNTYLRGWKKYFSKGNPASALRELKCYTEERLIRHLKRRSQRPYQAPDGGESI